MSDAHVSHLAAEIRDSHAPLRIVGAGTWLHGGGPWAEAAPLHAGDHRGIVEYTPGDLVITVRAGTTLTELADATGEHGQMLAIAPYGVSGATIGAVVATASPAPLAFGDYTVRDLVLGVQVITGNGDVTRVGGRVVKNVAGFDLVRLHTGAYGTLGLITEVSLRLHARPDVDVVVSGTVQHASAGALDDLLPRLLAQRAALPMLLVSEPHAEPQLWARISGNVARAHALRAQFSSYGIATPQDMSPAAVQETLQHTPSEAVVIRARTYRSDAVPFLRAARDAFPEATLFYDPAHGSLRVLLPGRSAGTLERDIATWYRLAAGSGARHKISVVVDQGRTLTAPFSTPRTALDEGIKRALDPRDVLNPLAAVAMPRLAHADA